MAGVSWPENCTLMCGGGEVYNESRNGCDVCGEDLWCAGGLSAAVACPALSRSVAGSWSAESCVCVGGYMRRQQGEDCVECGGGGNYCYICLL